MTLKLPHTISTPTNKGRPPWEIKMNIFLITMSDSAGVHSDHNMFKLIDIKYCPKYTVQENY